MVTSLKDIAEGLIQSGEAARILGLSQVTVLDMAKTGRLPVALKVGALHFFHRQVIEAIAKERGLR